MAETKRVILRHPEGISTIETDDEFDLLQSFINWIILHGRFLDQKEKKNEYCFTFGFSKYVAICNVKWRKLCNNS